MHPPVPFEGKKTEERLETEPTRERLETKPETISTAKQPVEVINPQTGSDKLEPHNLRNKRKLREKGFESHNF